MSSQEPAPTNAAWLQDIDERCRNMAEITRQREESNVIQLPLWSEGRRGSPNSFLRSALFAAIKERNMVKNVLIFSQQNFSVKFTGEELNIEDETVWLTLTDLARQHPLGTECSFTAYSILKHMGLKDDGRQRKTLYNSIHRLMACGVEIKADRITYGGSLVDDFIVDEVTGHYRLTLNKKLINIFGENDWTALNWEQRKKLRNKPLAQKLLGYWSSHEFPKPVTVEFLHDIAGSKTKEKFKFKQSLKAALESLVKIGFLESYEIEAKRELVIVKRVHKTLALQKYLGD